MAQGLPLEDEQSMRQIIALKQSQLGTSKLFGKAPVAIAQHARTEQTEQTDVRDELFEAYDQATRDLIRVHFACVRLGWSDADLRAQLKPIFDITRPWIEQASEDCRGRGTARQNSRHSGRQSAPAGPGRGI
jgi:hypothetical protein